MDTSMQNHPQDDMGNPTPISSPTSNPAHVSVTRSDPYPTTFVQADTSTFKQVVQMLTGSSETTSKQSPSHDHKSSGFVIPPVKKQSSFKLYERRQNSLIKNSLMINTLRISSPRMTAAMNEHSPRFSPRKADILSPSLLDFPKLALHSPVTPLSNEDTFSKSSPLSLGNSSEEEERAAIAEKGFYLHPSPISTPRDSQPQLLPLFPVTSPKLSSGSSS